MTLEEVSCIFVYGTLKRGQLRESHWPRAPLSIHTAFLQADLYDLGPYPAISHGTNWVGGECWKIRLDDVIPTLAVLDEIEGYVPGRLKNLYDRRVVDVYESPWLDSYQLTRAFAYFIDTVKLPQNARLISPKRSLQHPTGCDEKEFCFAQWPEFDEHYSQTSILPDPYPDFI